MARSNYVYTVQHPESGQVIAAFTVKHELESWLTRWLDDGTIRPDSPVWRVRDGWDTSGRTYLGHAADLIEPKETT